jgi:hypothetical protein
VDYPFFPLIPFFPEGPADDYLLLLLDEGEAPF